MNLYLTSKWESPYDGVYFTEERLPVYRVVFTAGSGKRSSSLKIDRATSDPHQNLPKYDTVAEFEFHRWDKDLLNINGTTYQAHEFFSKQTPQPAGTTNSDTAIKLGSDRIFRGTDGQEYKWTLGKKCSQLYLNSGGKQLIAAFHPRKHGLLGIRARTPPYLEITPLGMEMMDLVFCTFIYVEKIRSEREQDDSMDWDRPGII
ncbi:hypothetical protein CVT24_009269 [Panaeolus cyanescens]|uniref:DUF6593 domain-containing protein n=1 Tax=Panaeolus cyanescens TaxID=181874 RepID=A0A409Y883_9AGAR|nr:hypothetical protein CVT24_009269 [Panaeolus cyanescens]